MKIAPVTLPKPVVVTDGTPKVAPPAAATAAAAAAAEVKTLPWRCVACWRAGKDVQLKNVDQADPTGRVTCPECSGSWWGKTGLDA